MDGLKFFRIDFVKSITPDLSANIHLKRGVNTIFLWEKTYWPPWAREIIFLAVKNLKDSPKSLLKQKTKKILGLSPSKSKRNEIFKYLLKPTNGQQPDTLSI